MRPALLFALLGVTCAAPFPSATQTVQFDVGSAVAARDVTTDEFRIANPNEILLEITLNISSLIEGREPDLDHYLYRIQSPHESLLVVDYLPKTTMATDVVGHYGIEKLNEKTGSISIDVSGKYDAVVAGSAAGGQSSLRRSRVSYELLPKLELLAAAGTIGRGAGVYFKLHPSPRTSLEGSKQFVMTVRAPVYFRADELHVHCQAVGKRPLGEDPLGLIAAAPRLGLWGSQEFLVRLYREGDVAAKQAAWDVVAAERGFADAVREERARLAKLAKTDISFPFGRLPSIRAPAIPERWIGVAMSSPHLANAESIYDALPLEVKTAWDDYQSAQGQLRRIAHAANDP